MAPVASAVRNITVRMLAAKEEERQRENQEEIRQREIAMLKIIAQKVEQKEMMEPTSLKGAVKQHNIMNAGAKVLSQGAQQRLRPRAAARQDERHESASSGSLVQFLCKKSPKRERERGTTVARTSLSKVAVAHTARLDSNVDSSDNEEMDAIRMQRCKVALEQQKLERMEARYAMAKEQRK